MEPRGKDLSPKRIVVSDPMGSGAEFLQTHAARWNAQIISFPQAASAALDAARNGGDLVFLFRPDTLAPLERLRNDPHTRHIPILLAIGSLDDPERKLLAIVGADQILDYPFEEEKVLLWVEAALKKDFRRSGAQEYAQAKLHETGEAHWAGRVSWVSGTHLRFETDLLAAVGDEFPFGGALASVYGSDPLTARVLSASRDDVFYNHEVRLELELQLPHGRPNLSQLAGGTGGATAPEKFKIALISPRGFSMNQLADSIDNSRFAVRYIADLDRLGPILTHMHPALLIIDPDHPDLSDPMRAGSLTRAARQGLKILPLKTPTVRKFWEKLGPSCPTIEVPELTRGTGWDDLLANHALAHTGATDPNRAYIRRDHLFSHARLTTPVTLADITEVGGGVFLDWTVAEQARVRLSFPALGQAGIPAVYGRALRGARAKERLELAWMGVGDEERARRLRFFVHETIIASRRKEFEES